MRKVHVPWMRRHVGTFGHEAHVAKVTTVHYFPVFLLLDAVQLAASAFIYEVKQSRKCRTQIDAAAAAMTDVKNTLRLIEQLGFVVKIWILPVEWMALWRLQTAFAGGHGNGENK